jgi:histidyl-tRNA synthetase
MLGGRPTPGVGFGSGLERLLIALESQGVLLPGSSKQLIWLISQSPAAREANLKLLRELRQAGFAADMDPTDRSFKAQFKLADREKAAFAIIVGDNELAGNTVALKNLKTGEQSSVNRGEIESALRSRLA